MENWAEIRRLHRSEQMPIKAIARVLGVSTNTVRRALRAGEPPRYERADDRLGNHPGQGRALPFRAEGHENHLSAQRIF